MFGSDLPKVDGENEKYDYKNVSREFLKNYFTLFGPNCDLFYDHFLSIYILLLGGCRARPANRSKAGLARIPIINRYGSGELHSGQDGRRADPILPFGNTSLIYNGL